MSTQVPQKPEQAERRRRIVTLVVASISAAVAAVLVRKIWGPGTVIGAAATPVIVALLADALSRPAERIRTVAVPTLPGSRPAPGAQTGAVGRPRPRGTDGRPQEQVAQVRSSLPQVSRRGLLAALGVGLVAFVIGVGLLTGGELVLGDSAGPNERRTTVFGGGGSDKPKQDKGGEEAPTAPGKTAPTTTQTTTQTTTETTPAPAPPPVTEEQPTAPAQEAPPVAPPAEGTTGP